MGYILPIQQHEYTDYQKRMFVKRRNIEAVKKTYKTELQLSYEELKREKDNPNQPVALRQRELYNEQASTEEILIELTGLGKHINERI
ncbi:hypothetical protein [Ornithinibacillus halotolerans]|uniref:Uncharacterized protein n=1 Tax=Ornithinibacillus halotolerans TaxID=1274357 RepID=A0A916RYV0_9BACI|nr:hypothetical protein [Ornithinibacillus halotolerans]GGA74192.1 hypothetical protein GCM10008025_17440 [Ornithinibacillus halotolerans]